MSHQQQLAAARTQLLADCQEQLATLVYATRVAIDAFPTDKQSRQLCEAFATVAAGTIDNIKTSIGVAIDAAVDDEQLDSEPTTIEPGQLLKTAIGLEVALCMSAALNPHAPTEEHMAEVNQQLDRLATTARQLIEPVAEVDSANHSIGETIASMRARLDQLEAAAVDPDKLATVATLTRCLPDSLQAGIAHIRQGITAWRGALREFNAPNN